MLSALGFILLVVLRLIGWLLLLTLVIVATVLVIPFPYRLQAHRFDEDAAADAQVAWLFGLLSFHASWNERNGFQMRMLICSRWALPDVRGKPKSAKEAEEPEKKKKKPRQTTRTRFRWTRDKLKRLVNAAIRLLDRLLPSEFMLDARIGFEDPASTGLMCAWLAPLHPFLARHPDRFRIRLVPVFEEQALSGSTRIRGFILIWFIVWEALKLAISKPFRQDIFHMLGPERVRLQGGQHV